MDILAIEHTGIDRYGTRELRFTSKGIKFIAELSEPVQPINGNQIFGRDIRLYISVRVRFTWTRSGNISECEEICGYIYGHMECSSHTERYLFL